MKYYIKTFGCQMNVSDSERIAGFLEAQKFKPAKDIHKADLAIFNTCGVRQTAENSAMGQIHNLREAQPQTKIILTGCLANRKDVQKKLEGKVDLFCEIKDFAEKFVGVQFIEPKNKKTKSGFDKSNPYYENYLCIVPKYSNKKSAFVPIMTGCNNFCSYCVVPYARGREVSRSVEDIFAEIKKLAKNGCQEITLLGQNVNSYNFRPQGSEKPDPWGLKFNFPQLLDYLAQTFPQITFNFLTSHPKDFSEQLMQVIAKNKNVNREIHLPLQSGSDKILGAMNRPYTQKYYLNLIKKAQKIILGVSFTTDVIVGFPSETEKDFQKTVEVFKKVKYNEAYINKYSPRPGTTAEKLGDPISWEEKKRREKVLRKLIFNGSSTSIMEAELPKIIVILGPTSSGKSDVAIKLAKKFNGEIISADSRQIYRGMDIGTGKITMAEQRMVKHYMLDIVSPRTEYNASKFKKYADKSIADIISRGKIPIICGGTGFWIKAVVDNITYPEVKPDFKLREKLNKKTTGELFTMLQKLDPARAKSIDAKNPARLIRAIEICESLGGVPLIPPRPLAGEGGQRPGEGKNYNFLQIGISLPKEKLQENIQRRLQKRFKAGMIEEVKKLHHQNKISWKRLESFGLVYKLIPQYLREEIKSKEELFEKIYSAEKNYAKRQMTWFKKDKRILWLEKYQMIEKEVEKFIRKYLF